MEVQARIEQRLTEAFEPVVLTVDNESYMHHVPEGSETHFKVVLVSDAFQGMLPVKRHQQVYQVLADEMQSAVHALALHTHTREEWDRLGGKVTASPNCKGGSNA
ncbi:BolA family protein [Parendozoicomonas haliclonae]|uniref:DNA-binding transcriptional regulator BolA n=1 Tax=Parendozoicomonas haliclonae TaxID=1960125 RepID=A0A1X7AR03_9GAMM|nr:BolA/IbaG family iron-sulfur metabolism protein [Parendozoicomonas haliclonae]SMA50529.1 transcriptional regulator BolA [Parendozoicomonas haliclonae]